MTVVPPPGYPGQLGIWRNQNLSFEEQGVEQRFAQQLEADLDYWMQTYQDRNGVVLDTDLARALCAEWDRSDETRARYASAVHNPASAFVSALYHRRLAQPAVAGRDLVVFTAGGGGSGKTTAVQERQAALLEEAHLVYDTTLAGLPPAVEKIDAALATGMAVVIIYVYRPFEDAVRGVLDRALRTGRAVPLTVLAADHAGAPRTVRALMEHYSHDARLHIIIIDNSQPDVSQAALVLDTDRVRFLDAAAYNEVDVLQQRAQEVLENELRQR